MDILWFCLIGLAAGWLSGQILKTGSGTAIHNLIVGVIGAIIGGFLMRMIGFQATNLVGQLVSATIGAIVLLIALRTLSKR